ncbi:tRNA-binding protein [Fulvivirga sp. RKSG066]|uniref:tRNA-binding protein n=1 Tax=Fulvivirga aurantia TaxID=2529383 RepID=UPI0012BC631B|nr:tRNA-binding protein [Fulvivirga aurantia]MTI20086.1 tRNA-binding protein [Fulvivirga aurantia]
MSHITIDDFTKVDIRVGTITRVEPFEKAHKPAYIIHVDLGDIGVKKSSAQLTGKYSPKDLEGKQVICVVNFPEKQIGPIKSQVLITGFTDENGDIVIATTESSVPNGSKLH